jgi:hypothetical protein
MHGCYKNLIQRYLNDLKDNVPRYLGTSQISKYLKSQEPSNIQEDELPGDSIERNLECLATPLERFQNLKKILMVTPPKNLFHVMMLLFLLHQAHQWIFKMQQKGEVPKEGSGCIESL